MTSTTSSAAAGLGPSPTGKHAAGVPSAGPAESGTLEAAVELLGGVIDRIGEAVCLVDERLCVRFWNRAAERLSGRSAADMIGRSWAGHCAAGAAPAPTDGQVSLLASCLSTGEPLADRGHLLRDGGGWTPIESQAVPIRDHRGSLIGAAEIFRVMPLDSAVQSKSVKPAGFMPTDPLTQLVNRAGFDRTVQHQVEASRQAGRPLSLIIADLDEFRSINDTFGHEAGDALLKTFAGLLTRCCRPDDVVARYGGEEFAVLLPGCDGPTACRRAEEIRQGLESLVWGELQDRRVTASFGVTELEAGDKDLGWIGRADEALYHSKQAGGNRTEVRQDTQASGSWWWSGHRSGPEYICNWVVSSPGELTALKISGFLAEQHAKLLALSPSSVRVRIGRTSLLGRLGLRRDPAPLELELSLSRMHINPDTRVHLAVRPLHSRTPRDQFDARCFNVVENLRSYLMPDDPEIT